MFSTVSSELNRHTMIDNDLYYPARTCGKVDVGRQVGTFWKKNVDRRISGVQGAAKLIVSNGKLHD